MYSAKELVSRINSLATLPTIYERIRKEIALPDATVARISRLLETDPAITVTLLKLANSAWFRLGRRVDSVEEAITIIGFDQTRDLVLAMSVATVFDGVAPEWMDMKRYWQGSVATALAARELAFISSISVPERLFVLGLLADIGHLVMYRVKPALAGEALKNANADPELLPAAERQIVGCDAAEVGATLADAWNLPEGFAEAIRFQAIPREAGEYTCDAEVLHIARAVSYVYRYGEESDRALERIDPDIWQDLDLLPENFSAIRKAGEKRLGACMAFFFPHA